MPENSEARSGARNLTLAIVCLVLAAMGFWMGWYYAGAAAVRSLVACLATFGIIWLLLNLNVMRQRNGPLFALGLVALLAARERAEGDPSDPAKDAR